MMAGFGAPTYDPAGAVVTAYRDTEVTFDLDEVVNVEPPFTLRRHGRQIVPDKATPINQENVELLASGYWALIPNNDRLHQIHERVSGPPVMLLSEFNAIAHVKQEPLYRTATELPGLTTGSDAALATDTNDLFFTLRRPAGDSWDLDVTSSRSKPTQETENLLMDRVMEATADHTEDSGYLLRWQCPGTHRHAPDNILTFYFGGPLILGSFGEYAITFHGNGKVTLFEWAATTGWAQRKQWAYATPHLVMNQAHTMRIIPHVRKFIEFRSSTNALATPLLYQQDRHSGAYAAPSAAPTAEVYIVDPMATGQPNLHASFVTGPGPVRVDVRRDLRLSWQISRLEYPFQGSINDSVFVVPFGLGDAEPLFVTIDGKIHSYYDEDEVLQNLTDIITVIQDDQTSIDLPAHPEGGLELPGDENILRALFTFQSFAPQNYSPYLGGYTVRRSAHQDSISPGEFSSPVNEVSITGPTSDPTHETASLMVEDVTDDLALLRTRGALSVRVRTRYDADPSHHSILFRGRVIRPEAMKMGVEGGQSYPDPEYRRYEITCVGEWQRLSEQLMIGTRFYDKDPDETPDTNGNVPPWKITAVIHSLIQEAGYPDNQIDVPITDLDARLPLDPGAEGLITPGPFTTFADFIQRLARDFLGAFLVWDANARNGGFHGMWRLLYGPRVEPTDLPLWHFTNDEPLGAGPRVTFRSESYGANTSPIRRGTFRSWPVPPEANAVCVTATGHLLPDRAGTNLVQWAINYRSYNPAGGPNLAVPTHPDYIGHFVPLIVTDPGISGGKSGAEGQALVDAVTRRLFNFVCRAEKRAAWESELVLVQPADAYLAQPRPLRRGDFVTVDGEEFLIDTCNPQVTKDVYQSAAYEAVAWREED